MTSPASYAWVAQLTRRYELATLDAETSEASLLKQLPTLQLASAALHKVQLDSGQPSRSHHAAVLGPTQSGKSTVANLLLGTQAASVSALAGFTVHSQGYAQNIHASDIAYVDSLMAPLKRTPANSLDGQRLDCYVLEQVTTGNQAMLSDTIVWDTPDFDSISANSYSLAVLKTAALADVVMLVVSKDKYGDKRVWDMLDLLISLGKPLLVCINKLDSKDRTVIQTAFQTRFEERFGEPAPELVMLPFIKQEESAKALQLDSPTTLALRTALDRVQATVDHTTLTSHCEKFVMEHQAQWLEPLAAEVDARKYWMQMINECVNEADEYYADQYLGNPDKYETFNRALAELLTLLEIPGVAPALAQARKVITWPARRLLGVGRSALGKTPDIKRDTGGDVMDQEALVLEQMLNTTLIRLQRELLEAPGEPWWQALDKKLRMQLPHIKDQFAQSSKQTRQEFAPEIEKAAANLYGQLKKQPTLLNTLRAARVSADAAGVALAVKSGGLAPTDLILAPAMLSVTTLLTESALGRYLDSVKRELKQRQRQHVREHLLERSLASDLQALAEQLGSAELLSNNLESELERQLSQYQDRR